MPIGAKHAAPFRFVRAGRFFRVRNCGQTPGHSTNWWILTETRLNPGSVGHGANWHQ